MGMLWNSPATNEMISILNREFGPGFIRKWRNKQAKFGKGADPLHKIADDEDIYPDGGASGSSGKNWLAWLQYLSTAKAGGVGEAIRGYIYDGLDKTKFDEIAFVVVPLTDNAQVTATATAVSIGKKTTIQVITIGTPTWDAVYQFAKTKIGRNALKRLERDKAK